MEPQANKSRPRMTRIIFYLRAMLMLGAWSPTISGIENRFGEIAGHRRCRHIDQLADA
jgi:hypothetical protein